MEHGLHNTHETSQIRKQLYNHNLLSLAEEESSESFA